MTANKRRLATSGIPASSGYAEGLIFPIELPQIAYTAKGSPKLEAAALTNAIASATDSLTALAASAEGEAADMLEFQLAMLSDDALARPALQAVASGTPADSAWRAALDVEITGYSASGDDYFRARAADLTDIRDRVLRALTGMEEQRSPRGAILVGEEITPTRFLSTDWSAGGGIALAAGSTASHVAMLARARGVPMVVGLGAVPPAGSNALLDAERGALQVSPDEAAVARFRDDAAAFQARREAADTYLARTAATADGTPVRVMVNIADPADVDAINVAHCDGVGLMRTEFLFGKTLPDEEAQVRAYGKVLDWARGKPVTIRTVDAGGDKPVPGFTVEEGNPFLGLRGIRLALARPDVFRIQIRAMLRAATSGNLKVMFPMVAVPAEYKQAVDMFEEELSGLRAAAIPAAMPSLGIMVEVPSVAIAPELFADVGFFSIGSNDLTQYVMAAARDNGRVAALNDVHNPAVLRLIGNVAAFAKDHAVPLSLCGDAGGDPAAIPALLASGVRDLSVAPAQLAVAKAAVAGVRL